MIAVVAWMALGQTSPTPATLTAADFFPLVQGVRRTYQENGPFNSITVDEVGETVIIDGKPATKVITRMNDKPIGVAFYRLEPDGVYLVANVENKPLKPAIPMFKFSGEKTEWSLASNVSAGGHNIDMVNSAGTATLGPVRDVLGKRVETLLVEVKAIVGDNGPTEKVTQSYVFGKGIGLISLTTTTAITRKKKPAKSSLQIIKVDEPYKEG